MTQYELERLWADGSLRGVAYGFGNEVRVKSGGRAGEVGRVVALLAVEPQPEYVVEYPDGRSITAAESDLERA